MKKILFFAAALAVVSLASCGNGEKGEAVDSDTVVVAEVVDSVAVDSVNDSTAVVTEEVAAAAAEAVVPEAK